jgi:hypothetical protein
MPRAPARIRRRYIEGQTEVLDWQEEETLLYGVPLVFGPPCRLQTVEEWRREWSRWGDVILPKCIEHRPGTRPFAMYATGLIPARELAMPLPVSHGFWRVDVRHAGREIVTHWLNVGQPYMRHEVDHLHRLGIVDAAELKRHRTWMRTANAECSTCAADTYPLEMSTFE